MSYENLVSFGLTDALDVEQLFLGCVGHCLDGVETCVLQLLDVTGTDSTLLHAETLEQDRVEHNFTGRENNADVVGF